MAAVSGAGEESRTAVLQNVLEDLGARPRRWLVTGSAGFIGSHLVEALLRAGQEVVGMDDLSTGHRENLDLVRGAVGDAAWRRHRFHEASIVSTAACRDAVKDVDIVLHQAALGSVPRSIADPLATHQANATGFLNMLIAARDARVQRFVYAASSSTYGDHPDLPKVEDRIGAPLSPYAVTKYVDELYAGVFTRAYGIATVGLRYFNVFGPRQDPAGAYAAVIPRWIAAMLGGEAVTIYGDGETSRDFCYVDNVVQANLLAALAPAGAVQGEVYNVAVGGRMSLNALHAALAAAMREQHPRIEVAPPRFEAFRGGDVRHSQADIGKARAGLGYEPACSVDEGLARTLAWFSRSGSAKLALQRACGD